MPKKSASDQTSVSLSVVVPAYNAAPWLPKSVPKTAQAIKNAGIKQAEFIIVDDGSSDDTAAVARSLKVGFPVKVVSQPNSGRFVARDNGVKQAKYEYVLFIDTRIFIGENALKYVVSHLNAEQAGPKRPKRQVWTSHVIIDRKGNPYARFWEALTFIAWRRYFAHPRDCSFGIDDFDHYPKGTTCFFVPKKVIQAANDWFKENTRNDKLSNDDTLLIRQIAAEQRINLSPEFFCTYHARTNLKQYCKHVYHRGKVFVDGFLRRDGNRFFWPLLAFLALSIAVPVYLIFNLQLIAVALILLAAAWLLELLAALLLSVPAKDALSLFALSPIFTVMYGAGIWMAVIKTYVVRKA